MMLEPSLLLAVALVAGGINGESEPRTRAGERDDAYAVVVSRATHADKGWQRVVLALVEKHGARVIEHAGDVDTALPALRSPFPRHVCFVATPAEAGRDFVARVHRLMRRLDEDPYTDSLWGILTGYDADNALEVARESRPLVIRRAASGTEIELDCCEEGVWYCELEKNRMVRKEPGKDALRLEGPGDTTEALVKTLTEYGAQLFVTSGHATERDWQIGYRYRNGSFRSDAGRLFAVDTVGRTLPIRSSRPRVYLPVGNCLMGHIDGPDAMALAFMNSAGVRQMIGYTVVTWYGYAGWGCLDYFLEQPGRYTFAEAFFANQQALLHRLETFFPGAARLDPAPGQISRAEVSVGEKARSGGLGARDARGLLFDRDVLAFYGDPAWEARLAAKPCAWEQELREEGRFVFEVRPRRGRESFAPVNTNGSQRGGRPVVELFARRLTGVEILEGRELEPVITDNFILVPLPDRAADGQVLRVVFTASPAGP